MENKAHGFMDLLSPAGVVDKKSVYYSRFLFSWQACHEILFFIRYPKKSTDKGNLFGFPKKGKKKLSLPKKFWVDRAALFPL